MRYQIDPNTYQSICRYQNNRALVLQHNSITSLAHWLTTISYLYSLTDYSLHKISFLLNLQRANQLKDAESLNGKWVAEPYEVRNSHWGDRSLIHLRDKSFDSFISRTRSAWNISSVLGTTSKPLTNYWSSWKQRKLKGFQLYILTLKRLSTL